MRRVDCVTPVYYDGVLCEDSVPIMMMLGYSTECYTLCAVMVS